MAIADVVADRFTAHEVNLARFEAHERRVLTTMLEDLRKDLERQLKQIIPSDGLPTFQRRKLAALYRTTSKILGKGYGRIDRRFRRDLEQLSALEVEQAQSIVNRAVKVNLLSVGVPETTLKSLVNEETVLGAPLKEWWSRQAGTLQANFIHAVRTGVFAGETLSQLVRRIRGTKAAGFKDGIMEVSRRGAETLVRTGVQSVLNDARLRMYEQNGDIVRGVQALVTLDLRTSDLCIARSGSAWDLDGKPLNDRTKENFPGPPPWHPNCRTTLVPVVKGFEELIRDPNVRADVKKALDKLPKGTRASMDGQVARDLTYQEWLRMRSEAEQQQVLGIGKWKLWKEGKIGLRDLIDQTGRPLTLEELKHAG